MLSGIWMNNRNTKGEAIFVRGTKTYEPPVDDDPVPGSLRWRGNDEGVVMSDAAPEPLIMGAQYAQAMPASAPGFAPSPAPATLPAPTPIPQPPGQVIRPNIPQWNRPPPTPNPTGGLVSRLGRFGRFAGPAAAFVAGMWPSSTAMPWMSEAPQDDFERELFKKARELDEQDVDSDDIAE